MAGLMQPSRFPCQHLEPATKLNPGSFWITPSQGTNMRPGCDAGKKKKETIVVLNAHVRSMGLQKLKGRMRLVSVCVIQLSCWPKTDVRMPLSLSLYLSPSPSPCPAGAAQGAAGAATEVLAHLTQSHALRASDIHGSNLHVCVCVMNHLLVAFTC